MKKIEWNKVTWYSKLIAAVLFVVILTGGFWLGLYAGYLKGYISGVEYFLPGADISTTTITTGSTAGSYYHNVAEWQTAEDSAGAFSIAYPGDFSTNDGAIPEVTQNWSLSSNGTTGDLFFTLTIPSLFEPQTNFADATLTVGASKDATAVMQCLTSNMTDGPITATSTETINGVVFTVLPSSGVGAGNIYDTTSYRTVHNGKCYAVEYTIHSSQLGNYPTQYNLQQFDPAPLKDVLNRIVGTFKFE